MRNENAARLFARVLTLVAAFAALSAQAQSALTPIRISVQPGNYAALATRVAAKLGYWQDAGFAPTFVTYAAGVPQIKAHADWDIGVTGAVPALIGARDYDLVTIAVSNDESRTTVVMGKKDLVAKLRQTRQIPNGTRFAVTLNSTGDYAGQTCLALWGGKSKTDMVYTGMPPPEVVAAGAAGTTDLVVVWAPNTYTMEEKHGFETLCSGKDFSPGVFGVIVAGRQWAKSNPETVSRALAVILRANRWIQNNGPAAQQALIELAAKDNITISPLAAKKDNEQRPLFALDDQIVLLQGSTASASGSRLAQSFYSLNVFLNEGKLQTRLFRASSFVDASYLEGVKSNPTLTQLIQRP
jgi:sulfonate transport system substrate-binding protein